MIAVTDTGLVPMRVGKAVGLQHGDEIFEYMVERAHMFDLARASEARFSA
jgi:hypothetical protein